MAFLKMQNMLEVFQSGFKTSHSTKTALLRVFNDVFITTDSGDCVILVLLDLTAAFETTDHEILLFLLEQWVGIRGRALECFRSYLVGRNFCVSLGGYSSSSAPLLSGVPQSSVLGPLLFSLYLVPLGSMLKKHSISFHCYADGIQNYIPLTKHDLYSVRQLLMYLDDIKAWIASNFLNFNKKKRLK